MADTSTDQVTTYLAEVREREQAAVAEPWHLETDSCDCGGDYPCQHGAFPWALVLPVPKIERPENDPLRDYDFKYSEVAELPMATAEFLIEARPAVPRLLAVAEAALALVTEWRNDAASLDRRAGKAADAGEESRSLLLSYRAQAHTDCAAQLHGAIFAALLREGENGHD